ncbi:MAG: glycosyltransferase [Pirellulales bacterium]
MHVVLMTLGSAGDIHPFVRIGSELRERGHDVTLVTSDVFRPIAETAGFRFLSIASQQEHAEVSANSGLWKPRRGMAVFVRAVILAFMRRQYAILKECADAGRCDVVIATAPCVGARIAQENLRLNLITAHLAPFYFRSVYRNRKLPGVAIPDWAPRGLKHALFRLGDFLGDVAFGGEINDFRAELGLRPVHRIFWDWWNSPQLVLGLFPAWFAPPQPDWPRQTHLAGFPFYDDARDKSLTPELEEFLNSGEPPIVFTPGTEMAHGVEFFETSLAVVQQLKRRAIFLSRFVQQLPPNLPAEVRGFSYVPFSQLLPRCAAIVQHGGIGTTSYALAAGIPQLVMPMGFDQPDNAFRVEQLGTGLTVLPRTYSVQRVTSLLETLLQSPRIRDRCRMVAGRLADGNGLQSACEQIERVASPLAR